MCRLLRPYCWLKGHQMLLGFVGEAVPYRGRPLFPTWDECDRCEMEENLVWHEVSV